MKIRVKLKEINDAPKLNAWEMFCDKYGYDYYCMNEFWASDTEVDIDIEDAKIYGLIKSE